MASLNECNFIGNLGADPEIKTLQSGNKVANFSIACTEKWKDKSSGEARESTEWVRVVVWQEGLVRVVEQYLKKGSSVYVKGKMQTRKYEKDGRDVYTTEIVLQGFGGSIIMLGGKQSGDGGQQRDSGGGQSSGSSSGRPGQNRGNEPAFERGGIDDDIPF